MRRPLSWLNRRKTPNSFHNLTFSGSDVARLESVEEFCSWPRQYYSVTEMLTQISDARTVVEVGVAYGYHARHLLSTIPQIRYTGVDPYKADYDLNDSFTSDVAHIFDANSQDAMNRLHTAVSERLSSEFGDRFRLVRKPSIEAAGDFADGSVDLIFIDGDHQYGSVRQDLNTWYPKIRPGGLMIGDDYAWPGVERAVKEFSAHQGTPAVSVASTESGHALFLIRV